MSIIQGFTAVLSKTVTGYIMLPCSNKALSVYNAMIYHTIVVFKSVTA